MAPLDWRALFGNDAPVEIDVGCGKGGYLLWAAAQRPAHNFLGVERQLVRLRKVDRKIHLAGLTNTRLLRCEAGYLLHKLIPARSVAVYHIYFPDPWPKRRHHPRRLIQPAFISELHRTLLPGGSVNVATDDADYFAHMEITFAASPLFDRHPPTPLPVEAQTEFEKIFLAQGKTIGRARFERVTV